MAPQDLSASAGGGAVAPLTLRPITEADHGFVLKLNEESVHFLAPMDEAHLRLLVGWATSAEIAERNGEPVGFVLLFGSGTGYDGVNYAWFADRYEDFLYLDRIVVSSAHRRCGIASAIYDLVERRHTRIVLEVNTVPPNLASLEFHHGRGYQPVGERGSDDGTYVVEMMLRERPPGEVRSAT